MKITINDNGVVSVPQKVKMRDFEIAQLFEVFNQAVRSNIRSLLKSGTIVPEYVPEVQVGNTIVPEYYGLEMVIAIAFRVKSRKADIFRRYVMGRISAPPSQPLFINVGGERIYS